MNEVEIRFARERAATTRVRLGAGAWSALPEAVAGAHRTLLVTDRNVATLPWFPRLLTALREGGPEPDVQEVAPGEAAKTPAAVAALWARWSAIPAGRDTVVVAVGGGAVSDVAGFAAATYLRGVPWVVVPTTVLSMADAAVGGKTGVNTASGKNLAGALHQPTHVIADLEALDTLDAPTYRDGWAEVVKAGAIGDAGLFDALLSGADAGLSRDPDVTGDLLAAAVRVKGAVVAADERETGRREILNFGHAAAHAVEHVSGLAVSHGAAVAAGMVAEARLGAELGRTPQDLASRLERVLSAWGLPTRAPQGLDAEALLGALATDKKTRGGRLRVSLPRALGEHDDDPSVVVEAEALVAHLLGGDDG